MSYPNITVKAYFFIVVLFACSGAARAQTVTSSDFAAVPPLISDSTDPFVMISLSVELTQQAEAFTGARQTYANGTYCPGRVSNLSVCYTADEEYIGYFDPDKCYEYVTSSGSIYDGTPYVANAILQSATGPDLVNNQTTDYFRPVGPSTGHTCSGNQFSGNFMNWSTMTALDEFRYAMTGGARLVDTVGATAQTLLTRTHRYGDWAFAMKVIEDGGISTGGETFTNSPSDVTPFSSSGLIIVNHNGNNGNRVLFRDDTGASIAELNVIVEVCNDTVDIEENCVEYTNGTDTWYKPEGVLQQNSLNMRYALTSYAAQNGNARNGGVLRSNAKYIGYLRPILEGGLEVNPGAEVNEFGQYVFHPDSATLVANGEDISGVNNSGILNYINSFGLGPNRYKGNDPVSELYYEGLRYIMGLDPTPEYSGASGALPALTAAQKDNFPVITNVWDDPILDACQANYIVGIGDQFSWADGDLPGTVQASGWGAPSGAPTNATDVGFNVANLTNNIGILEGMGGGLAWGSTGRRNTYYVAGMAYFAVTEDIRDGQGGAPAFDGDQHVKTFFVDTQEYSTSAPQRHNNPLWLAAKYGGFDDVDEDGDPHNGDTPTGSAAATCGSTSEWDADGDCEPESYTLASQPRNLILGLEHAFNEIAERVNAGSAAGVVSNTASGQGLIVQGLFKPKQTDDNGNIVAWGGMLQSLFLDEFNNFREDSDGNGRITDTDSVIVFNVDDGRESVTIDRYGASNGGETVGVTPFETGVDIEDLDTIWDARDELSALSPASLYTQRPYQSAPSSTYSRTIYTAIDSNHDGLIFESEVIDFDQSNFPLISTDTNNRFRYLGLDSSSPDDQATNIVNYIRGVEVDGFRSRTVDYDDDGVEEVWRLGDIISSSPAIVSSPKIDERYDLKYDDVSFSTFNQRYRDRRHVIYTGANDGMLHAFNGGVFDRTDERFRPSGYPLGAELWAYVPYNVLPHLRWLTELSYPHVYYVDGIPQVFEANIFSDSNTHPGGWGTILVVGMRFGGGDIRFDPNSDDSGVDADNDDVTTRSSYIVMDITNPEDPPRLIAEISHEQMGYTTSRPTVIKSRVKDGSGRYAYNDDQWYLVMGSGPIGDDAVTKSQALIDGVSNQEAKVFVFDLQDLEFEQFAGLDYLTVPNSSGAFVGDFVAGDLSDEPNGGYADDAVYFGTVSGSVSNPAGDLMRLRLGNDSNFISGIDIDRLVERSPGQSLEQPFSGLPYTRKYRDEFWIFTGSGRFFNSSDQFNLEQMSYYGVREPKLSSGEFSYDSVVLSNDLVDVEGIQVQYVEGETNGLVYNSSGSTPFNVGPAGRSVGTFNALRSAIALEQGWYFNFDDSTALHAGRSDGFGPTVAFTEYIPSGDACEPLGATLLNLVHFQTGTAAPYGAAGPDHIRSDFGTDIADRSFEFSPGFVRDVEFVDGKITAQGNLGNLEAPVEPTRPRPPHSRMSWREIQIEW